MTKKNLPQMKNIASVILVTLAVVFVLLLLSRSRLEIPPESAVLVAVRTPEALSFRDPLTGLPAASDDGPAVFGVMVENMVEAWPLAGLDQAFLVIEAPVEAGIPRFIAFYEEGQGVEKIGPVRSARPYFIAWNNELDALYAHVGGSEAALDIIATGGTFDLNQYWHDENFWRESARSLPHNVYTSTNLLHSALAAARAVGRAPTPLYGTWLFKESLPDHPSAGPGVSVDFSTLTYRVTWVYDGSLNKYRRSQAGEPHLMEDGSGILADNVAVVITDVEILDEIGRRRVRTKGDGPAYVLRDGELIEGFWRKPSESERLRFYDVDGSEVIFNAGQTWIEVIAGADDFYSLL